MTKKRTQSPKKTKTTTTAKKPATKVVRVKKKHVWPYVLVALLLLVAIGYLLFTAGRDYFLTYQRLSGIAARQNN